MSDPSDGAKELPAPEYWMSVDDLEDRQLHYSIRAPGEYVVSGPIAQPGEVCGGRVFVSFASAELWAREFYGTRFRGRPDGIPEHSARWAFVVAQRGGDDGSDKK